MCHTLSESTHRTFQNLIHVVFILVNTFMIQRSFIPHDQKLNAKLRLGVYYDSSEQYILLKSHWRWMNIHMPLLVNDILCHGKSYHTSSQMDFDELNNFIELSEKSKILYIRGNANRNQTIHRHCLRCMHYIKWVQSF